MKYVPDEYGYEQTTTIRDRYNYEYPNRPSTIMAPSKIDGIKSMVDPIVRKYTYTVNQRIPDYTYERIQYDNSYKESVRRELASRLGEELLKTSIFTQIKYPIDDTGVGGVEVRGKCIVISIEDFENLLMSMGKL